ncbi:MAG: PqqD family protein [Planctomycetota bacterium]
MNTPPPRRLVRDRRTPWQKIQEEVVVVLPRERRVYLLNPTAGFLWDLLAEPRTAEELAGALEREFDVTFARALADVRNFTGSLAGAGVLRET